MKLKATFGVSIPTYCGDQDERDYMSLGDLRDWVDTTQKLGFTHLWHLDRLLAKAPPAYNTSWYEPITTLASIIPYLRTSKIGTAIVNITYRNPIVLAKQAATLDRLSDGRLILGLGQGWNKAELEACNISGAGRAQRFEEAVTILRRLLSEDTVTFQGKFWKLNSIGIEPRPIQRPGPPILIAGGGNHVHFERKTQTNSVEKKILMRVARLGDGWIARTDTRLDDIMKYVQIVKHYAKTLGKHPDQLMMAHQNFVFVLGRSGTETEARRRFSRFFMRPYGQIVTTYLVGSPGEIKSRVRKEVEAGINHFIVMPVGIDYEVLRFFSDEVMPEYA